LPLSPVHAEPRRWVPLPGQSRVGFEARFPLGDFSGRAEQVVGEFQGDAEDLKRPVTGALRVAVRNLSTGLGGRDRDMRQALGADTHPEIRYTVTGLEASFPAVSDRSDALLTIAGLLAIRGVERPVRFLGRARSRDGHLWVRGDATIRLSGFGIPQPRRFFMAVRDEVVLTFDLTLALAD
jgi:polyisoprenoid-binding protein YceI